MNKTKMKIVLAAIRLFNEQGMFNVLNQEIAVAAGISLSNFNYHFKTKKELVYTVCTYMREVLQERIAGNKVLSSEGNGLELSRIYFEFGRDFRFFYLDTPNILQTYPAMKEAMYEQINESIQIIKNLNYLAIGKGLMKPEPTEMPGLYNQLAHQIWITSHFWVGQANVRGKEASDISEGLEAYFAICYPYLTEAGVKSYRAFIDQMKIEGNQQMDLAH